MVAREHIAIRAGVGQVSLSDRFAIIVFDEYAFAAGEFEFLW